MKKLVILIVVLSMLVTLTPVTIGAQTFEIVPEFYQSEPEMILPQGPEYEQFRGTTPRPDDLRRSDNPISPEMVDKATQLYNNFIKAPVALFKWTDMGIVESTKMGNLSELGAEAELGYIRSLAVELTKSCSTIDEKMYVIANYLAQNVCYDHDYLTHGVSPYPAIDPYSVLQNGYTVCSGYARTYEAMLQSIGIPCVYVYSPEHEWNMVYNGERWVLIDVTWMSNSKRDHGEFIKSERISDQWYDFTFEVAVSQYNHVIEELPFIYADGTLSRYPANNGVSSIYWPEGVEKIGSAFYNNRDLTGNLVIPDSVIIIDENAFSYCSGLTGNLVIPNNVTLIGDGAFYNCNGFTGNLVIGNGVTVIGDFAFSHCSGFMGSLSIGNSVTMIGENAFQGCSGFTGNLVIPDSATTIAKRAFYNCSGFTGNLIIGNSVTTIGDMAFYLCSGFTGNLEIPDDVMTIGSFAFYACSGISEVIIPESVQLVGDQAFCYCYSLQKATIYTPHMMFEGTAFLYAHRNFTIYGYNGSTAETYAKVNNHKFAALETKPTSFALTGIATSYLKDSDTVIIALFAPDTLEATYSVMVTGNTAAYKFEVTPGTYTMRVGKNNHVTKEYVITVVDANLMLDVKITPVGDLDGNGKVNTRDWNAVRDHINKSALIKDAYPFACADIDGNGKVNTRDWNAIRDHINKSAPLW